jgi:hypothetical protein
VLGSDEPGDSTGGSFYQPQDVAVNSTGVGGVAPGTFYVADGFNHRVQRFSPSGAFERAWGADVDLPAGGTDLEVCTVAANCKAGEPGGGNGATAGNGGLSYAAGVAVDGDTGNVYVTSLHAAQIDVYDADGTFLRAFGFDVVAGNAEFGYEVCVQAAGDVCQTGAQGTDTGQIGDGGGRLAITPSDGNPSTGRLYMAQFGLNGRIEVYDLDGANPSNFGSGTFMPDPSFGFFYSPRDIAVDAGIVYVDDKRFTPGGSEGERNEIKRYDVDSGTFLAPIDVTALASDIDSSQITMGLDIDPDSGNLLVARNDPEAGIVEIADPATAPAFADRHVAASFLDGVAVNPVSDEIIAVAQGKGILVFNDGPTPADATIGGVTDVGATGATLNAFVDSTVGGLPTDYRLQVSRNGVDWTTVANGTVAADDSETITAPIDRLLPNTLYRVRMLANRTLGNPDLVSAEVTFLTDAVKPEIGTSGADSIEETSVRLFGYVNPNSTPTSYRFEWGTASGSYPNRVPVPNESLGSGPTPVLAADEITGLQPGTTYYYRLVATSATEGTTTGPQRSVATRSAPLAARGVELVSPAVKSASGLVGSYLSSVEQISQIAEDGESVFYNLSHGLPDSTAGGDIRYMATRGEAGWSSVQMTPKLTVQSQPGFTGVYAGRYQYLAPDLSCGVLKSTQPLTPDASTAVLDRNGSNLFRRNNDGSYDLLAPEPSNAATLTLDNPATYVDLGYGVRGGSPDCRRVVFETPYRFDGANDSGLYISKDGAIESVGVLPDGSSAINVGVGSNWAGDDGTGWRSVSEDASHVYFTADSDDGSLGADGGPTRELYLWRDGEQTVKVSASETATANERAFYQAAATDGSRVAFLANYGLTADSSTGPVATNCLPDNLPRPCALYVYDVESGDLTDISASDDPTNTNGATVAGVFGASEDLSRVYFAAQGQLVAGKGRTYADNVAEAAYNVYLSDDGELTYIASVKSADVPSVGLSNLTTVVSATGGSWSVQVNPSGSTFLFVSRDNVVGYDSGGVGELYRYSVDTDETICLSCRRDGSQALPTLQLSPFQIQGHPLNPNRARMLSDDGRRAVFKLADALTPDAVDGNENFYLWDDGTLRLLYTEPTELNLNGEEMANLVGIDTSGDNIFLNTSSGLVPNDIDGVKDMYAFRVGGGFPVPPAPPVPCDPLADGCQDGGAGSVDTDTKTSSGGGNADVGERATLAIAGLSAKARRRAARSGTLALSVRTSSTGRLSLSVRAKLGRRTSQVGSVTQRVRKAGTVKVRLKLSLAARKRLRAGRRLRLTLVVSQPGARSLSRSVLLPGAGS